MLYFESLGSVVNVLNYKIKHHDVIQELTKTVKTKDKQINELTKEVAELHL